ncbi:uncharacterized protein SCHCODRAFT_02073351 [Schizophyllum commune H4-8]|uniref:DUF1365-domain-containing protein n=1 Tax=Schizophyllum commune (strain H4-8 / FGSC 9210) TaxID=578458 RepID=D8QFZ5_SCHCM|nr:uncharacterized protein SCHCODRAFT_02073351 [Schizophyllum commune H4-8]KAI5887848.1 hypothetical protein SCHCODRAFT_02073351 [Schizophyllum commune H4-8]
MPTLTDLALSFAVIVPVAFYAHSRIQLPKKARRGYVLFNSVTHARLLPAESSHSFTYPTISLFVSLNALEAHELDLGPAGLLLAYGRRFGTLLGLRSKPYLREGDAGIRDKLDALLRERRILVDGEKLIEDVWMMTMPSFMGFEGINPLTVYFVYAHGSGALWLVVLEIHNTFGEAHVHVLECGVKEDVQAIPSGYSHQWTFPRAFHVSPFNSRAGFYTVSVKAPSHIPIPASSPPRPAIRVHLHNPDSTNPNKPGDLKLTALLRATSSEVLSSGSLLRTLARAPFALLLPMARILYQAYILHYVKRLDVYIRPEPIYGAGGVRWLKEGFLERRARLVLEEFLRKRAEELGTAVSLVPADPDGRTVTFYPDNQAGVPSQANAPGSHLEIRYLTPRFFMLMLAAPSAEHALLLGYETDCVIIPSSIDLFLRVFSSPLEVSTGSLSSESPAGLPSSGSLAGSLSSEPPAEPLSFSQEIRLAPLPDSITLPIPAKHFSHPYGSSTVITLLQLYLDALERRIFSLVGARVVPGDEPWLQWERAARVYKGGRVERQRDALGLGSVRSDPAK